MLFINTYPRRVINIITSNIQQHVPESSWEIKCAKYFGVLVIHSPLSSSSVFMVRVQKEHYLGLVIGNDNWWRTHGINCKSSSLVSTANVTNQTGGSGESAIEEEGCVLSYAVIETIHAAIYMLLTVSLPMVLDVIITDYL